MGFQLARVCTRSDVPFGSSEQRIILVRVLDVALPGREHGERTGRNHARPIDGMRRSTYWHQGLVGTPAQGFGIVGSTGMGLR